MHYFTCLVLWLQHIMSLQLFYHFTAACTVVRFVYACYAVLWVSACASSACATFSWALLNGHALFCEQASCGSNSLDVYRHMMNKSTVIYACVCVPWTTCDLIYDLLGITYGHSKLTKLATVIKWKQSGPFFWVSTKEDPMRSRNWSTGHSN